MGLPPISFTGFSEFSDDFQVILERTFEAASLPVTQLQSRQSRLITQQQLLGELRGSLETLESDFSALGLVGARNAVTAGSTGESVVTVTTSGTVEESSFDLDVSSVARAAQEATVNGLADTDSTPLTADGITELTLGSTATTIDLLTIGSGRTAGTTGDATPSPPVSVQVDFSNGLSGSITAELDSFFAADAAPAGATAGDEVSVTFVSEDGSINETVTATLAGGEDAAGIAALLNGEIAANANLDGKVSFSSASGKLKLTQSDTAGQGFSFTSTSTGSVTTGLESGSVTGGHSAEEIAAALNGQVAADDELSAAGVTFLAQDGEVRVQGDQAFDITVTDNAQGTGFASGLAGNHSVAGFDNTLAGLRDFINSNSGELGVKAAIINTSSDPDAPSHHLTLTALATGATTLRLEDSGGVNLVTSSNQGADAQFTVNGVSVTNSSNTITNFAPGMTIEIVGTGTATVFAGTDRTEISDALANLVTSYNDVAAKIQAQIGQEAGLLSGHPMVRQAQQALRDITGFLGNAEGDVRSMAALGLELDDEGKLSFDAVAFNSLSDDQISEALDFIGNTSSGFAGSAASRLDSLSDPVNGQIATAIAFLQESDTALTRQIEREQERVDALIANLESRFAAADQLLSRLEAQQDTLTQIFDSFEAQLRNR